MVPAPRARPQAPSAAWPPLRLLAACLCGLAAAAPEAAEPEAAGLLQAGGQSSPVRRILNLLHSMTKKVEDHAKQEEGLFEEFICYCKTTSVALAKSVAEAQEKIPQLVSSVKEAQSSATQLTSDLQEHKGAREAAEQAIAESMQLRASEQRAFAAESTEMKDNIGNLQKAIKALEEARQGGGSEQGTGLLQKGALQSVRSLALTVNPERLRSADREAMAALLQELDLELEASGGSTATADVGEITGILKQMLENMEADLTKMTIADKASHGQVNALAQAKKREAATLTKAIEEKMSRLSSTQIEIVQLKSDLGSTRSGLTSDEKLLKDLDEECTNRKTEHVNMEKQLSAEMVAITGAIKVLGSDEASQAFKGVASTPPSFLQEGASPRSAGQDAAKRAAEMLQTLSAGSPEGSRLGFLASQAVAAVAAGAGAGHRRARGHAGAPSGFAKISQLVDQMIVLLKKEQEDDDLQQQMCTGEMAREISHKKSLAEAIEARSAELAAQEGEHQAVTKDTEALRLSVEELDKSVQSATKQRQEGNKHFVKVLTDTNAAVELLRVARGHLEKFYGNAAVLQQQLRQQQQVQAAANDEFGFFASSTAAEGSAGAGAAKLGQKVGPAKSVNEGSGAIQMLMQIEEDMKGEAEEAKRDEAKEQKEYEQFLAASTEKREVDVKALADRAATLAEVAETMRVFDKKRKALRGELDQTEAVIASLHKECDWLLQHHSERKKARAGEGEALKKTQAVLAGADYSLAQVKQVQRHVAL